ncbi:MAG: PepSY-associated TM helix domain-containing protein [Psychroflexus halocasei]
MKKNKDSVFRKFVLDIHLWLGIASGLILFLICLSGTILVFDKEIRAFFQEELVIEKNDQKKISLDVLSSKLDEFGEVQTVKIPESANEAYEFRIKTSPKERRGEIFKINPYTAEILKPQKTFADAVMMFFFKMHRWLLFDSSIGRPIVGIATMIFLVLTFSGLILWFPKKRIRWKSIKRGLKIKYKGKSSRLNHDLHNTLGFYASLFLIIMALTGLNWSFEWYRDLNSFVLGEKVFNRNAFSDYKTTSIKDETISFTEVYQKSKTEFPFPGDVDINFPSAENDVFKIRKYHAESLSPVFYDQLIIDQNAEVLYKQSFKDQALNAQIASHIKALHTGEIYGWLSKWIYFLACLIATSLPITGSIIFANKLKLKRQKMLKQNLKVNWHRKF